jgi:hypothetical protein
MSASAAVLTRPGIPRVNLLPRIEVDRRERSSLTRRWLWGVLGALLVALLVVAGTFLVKWAADQRLAAEQARTTALLLELAALSEVSAALSTEGELVDFRAQSMGSDFSWAPVIATLQTSLPAGVSLTGFDVITGGVPQGDDPALEVGLIGTATLSSPNAIDIAQTVRALRAAPGIADADGQLVSTSQQTVGVYTYEVGVAFDQTIYSDDFTAGGQ